MDTSRDYRILVCEKALEKYQRVIKTAHLPFPVKREKLLALAQKAHALLMEVKYSFLPAEQLVSMGQLAELARLGAELASFVREKPVRTLTERDRYTAALIAWVGRTLSGLPARIELGEDNRPEYAVDIYAGRVESVSKLQGSRNLYVTNVNTSREVVTVVTNLADVKKGQIRAIAFLPPREFMGVVSEAMYCSSPLTVDVGIRPSPKHLDLKEVINAVELIANKGL